VGFLFPQNYGNTLSDQVPESSDLQLLYFRAFFSGGSTSNRGYPFRAVGPHGVAPFFAPSIVAANALRDECNPASPNYDETVCAVPLGGLSLWESSVELRFDVYGALGAAIFLDGSDVSRNKMNLRLNYPHLSTGAGVRVDTPVGALRADLGYRIPGMQKLGGQLDPSVDGDPGNFWGAPITLSIGVGEAF
jgi:outer membrane protein insertion porin family/translocation and assembly module TamA